MRQYKRPESQPRTGYWVIGVTIGIAIRFASAAAVYLRRNGKGTGQIQAERIGPWPCRTSSLSTTPLYLGRGDCIEPSGACQEGPALHPGLSTLKNTGKCQTGELQH